MSKIKIDNNLCVHCGACTGVCKSSALYQDLLTAKTCFISEKCTSCSACAVACPRRAIQE